ncbi:MAG: GTPase Era [Bacteroidota bacterium]
MKEKRKLGFKSGFVSIIGKPNVGKSTLMNALVGEDLSIITSKAQTTRHRIFGIMNGKDFQIVYSDTPGILNPQYQLQQNMMGFVNASLEDADAILYVTDIYETFENTEVEQRIKNSGIPVIFLLNKVDQAKGSQADDKIEYFKSVIDAKKYIAISALDKINLGEVMNSLLKLIPEHAPYFPQDDLTDRSERFFASEIVREKIFLNYKKEVPYSTEVVITEFFEEESIIRMRAEIYVERQSQKGIIIGKGGAALKKVGIAARTDLEKFFNKQIHLETFVKVEKDWRKKDQSLKKFGY